MSNKILTAPPARANCDVNLLSPFKRKSFQQTIADIEESWDRINRDNILHSGEDAKIKCVACFKALHKAGLSDSSDWDDGVTMEFVKKAPNVMFYEHKGVKTKKTHSNNYSFRCDARGCNASWTIELEEMKKPADRKDPLTKKGD
jgi:hypothetical protein